MLTIKLTRGGRRTLAGGLRPQKIGYTLLEELDRPIPSVVPTTIRHYAPRGGRVQRQDRLRRFVNGRAEAGVSVLKIYDAEGNLLWRYYSSEINVRVEVFHRCGAFITGITPNHLRR